jgi:serine/threonine protein phosphatase 1
MVSRLIAIGDIHGCFDQLKMMIEDKLQITEQDKVILIGDYIDRGPAIRETIEYIIGLKEKGYDLITLRGNHEVMLLNSFKTGDFSMWLWNGAESTLDSFQIEITDSPEEKYMHFFESLQWYHKEGGFLFVHAGFNNDDPFGDRHAMVWTRNEIYTNPLLTGRIIVHGHTPITVEQCIERAGSNNHVINIDTGCVYGDPGYGTLTAIELNSRELFFV